MIFLSYSRENEDLAVRVAEALRAKGCPVIRDRTRVRGDPFWRQGVRQALARSRAMLVLWSRSAARSPWVDQEIRSFKGARCFLRLDGAPLPEGVGRDSAVTGRCDPGARGHGFAAPDRTPGAGPAARQEGDCRDCRPPPDAALPGPEDDPGGGEAEEVSRRRRQCLEAEAARLEALRHGLAGRQPRATRLDERTLHLHDGSRLIRLPGATSAATGPPADAYLSATPVTNEQYRRFVAATGYPAPPTWRFAVFRKREAPVVGVTWYEAMAYAARVGGELPAQEEWERAATGADPGVVYATTDGRRPEEVAHFGILPGEGAPVENAAHPPNRLGFYGMCGNTWDWCSTPCGPHKIIRGGGYMDSAFFCRARAWYRNAPIDRDCSVGFRIKLVVRTNSGD